MTRSKPGSEIRATCIRDSKVSSARSPDRHRNSRCWPVAKRSSSSASTSASVHSHSMTKRIVAYPIPNSRITTRPFARKLPIDTPTRTSTTSTRLPLGTTGRDVLAQRLVGRGWQQAGRRDADCTRDSPEEISRLVANHYHTLPGSFAPWQAMPDPRRSPDVRVAHIHHPNSNRPGNIRHEAERSPQATQSHRRSARPCQRNCAAIP